MRFRSNDLPLEQPRSRPHLPLAIQAELFTIYPAPISSQGRWWHWLSNCDVRR